MSHLSTCDIYLLVEFPIVHRRLLSNALAARKLNVCVPLSGDAGTTGRFISRWQISQRCLEARVADGVRVSFRLWRAQQLQIVLQPHSFSLRHFSLSAGSSYYLHIVVGGRGGPCLVTESIFLAFYVEIHSSYGRDMDRVIPAWLMNLYSHHCTLQLIILMAGI